MLRHKNGQIRMTETIAVLFIFFVLIFFGLVFYFTFQKNAVKEKQEELLGQRAIDTTLRTLFMPELTCTRGEVQPQGDCIDLAKLKSIEPREGSTRDGVTTTTSTPQDQPTFFEQNADNYYFELLSFSKIIVTEVYPNANTWVLYDKEKPKLIKKEPTHSVITLKEFDLFGNVEYHFGYITVEVYS